MTSALNPRKYFSVRTLETTPYLDGFDIVVTTDVPCHLWCRMSIYPPQEHIVPREIRGIALPGETYFCFVAYEDNEQTEPGDTLTHTFIKRNWAYCQTRWFYFWGSIGYVVAVSTTAPFKLHNKMKVKLHTHTYEIFLPDYAHIHFWLFNGVSASAGLTYCPLKHYRCAFMDTCYWQETPTRNIKSNTLSTSLSYYGEAHKHQALRVAALSVTPRTNLYEYRTSTCPAGHPNCGSGFYSKHYLRGIVTSLRVFNVDTEPVIDGDPNAEHYHYVKTQLHTSTDYARIDWVGECPLGHEDCANTQEWIRYYFYENRETLLYTSRDKEYP